MAASKSLTPEQRSIRARKAALDRWSRDDPAAAAIRGQAGLAARFDREAREFEPGLSDAEYARRAACAYRLISRRSRSPVRRPAVTARPASEAAGQASGPQDRESSGPPPSHRLAAANLTRNMMGVSCCSVASEKKPSTVPAMPTRGVRSWSVAAVRSLAALWKPRVLSRPTAVLCKPPQNPRSRARSRAGTPYRRGARARLIASAAGSTVPEAWEPVSGSHSNAPIIAPFASAAREHRSSTAGSRPNLRVAAELVHHSTTRCAHGREEPTNAAAKRRAPRSCIRR